MHVDEIDFGLLVMDHCLGESSCLTLLNDSLSICNNLTVASNAVMLRIEAE
jgi:hypothetical protein